MSGTKQRRKILRYLVDCR